MKAFFSKSGIIFFLPIVAGLISCEKVPDKIFLLRSPEPPIVLTNDPEDISTSSVYLSGEVVRSGSSSVSKCGFNIYPEGNNAADPYSGRPFQDYRYTSTSEGYFSIFIRNLQPNTTYNYRAVAANNEGTSYGDLRTFVTAGDTINYKKNRKK